MNCMRYRDVFITALVCITAVSQSQTIADCLDGPGGSLPAGCEAIDDAGSSGVGQGDGVVTLRDYIRILREVPAILSNEPCLTVDSGTRFYQLCETSFRNQLAAGGANFMLLDREVCQEQSGGPVAFSLDALAIFSVIGSTRSWFQAGNGRWRGVSDRPMGLGPNDVFLAQYLEVNALNTNTGSNLAGSFNRQFADLVTSGDILPGINNSFELGEIIGSSVFMSFIVNGSVVLSDTNFFISSSNRKFQLSTEIINFGDISVGSPGFPLSYTLGFTRSSPFGTNQAFRGDDCVGTPTLVNTGPLDSGNLDRWNMLWKNRTTQVRDFLTNSNTDSRNGLNP